MDRKTSLQWPSFRNGFSLKFMVMFRKSFLLLKCQGLIYETWVWARPFEEEFEYFWILCLTGLNLKKKLFFSIYSIICGNKVGYFCRMFGCLRRCLFQEGVGIGVNLLINKEPVGIDESQVVGYFKIPLMFIYSSFGS